MPKGPSALWACLLYTSEHGGEGGAAAGDGAGGGQQLAVHPFYERYLAEQVLERRELALGELSLIHI